MALKIKDFYDSETFKANLDRNDVRVIDDSIAQAMRDKIDEAKMKEIQLAVSFKL